MFKVAIVTDEVSSDFETAGEIIFEWGNIEIIDPTFIISESTNLNSFI